jgi:hypothetical protein
MKLLQNRVFVGVMAVGALALVTWRIWPLVQRPARARPLPVIAPASSTALPTAAVSQPPTATTNKSDPRPVAEPLVIRQSGFDLSGVNVNAPSTGELPRRDPFQVHSVPTASQGSNPPAMQLLRLNAVLRQTGGALAVINNRVLSEGDTILGFTIETIGAEHVWVTSRGGKEELVFPQRIEENFEYRTVDGVTNNVTQDPGWRPLTGTIREKLSDNRYRVALGTNLIVVIRNLPFTLIDEQVLHPVRCKYVGTESYTARSGDKLTETVAAYDYGVPCDAPKAALDQQGTDHRANLAQTRLMSAQRAGADLEDARRGSASSQFILGRRYLDGEGVAKNENEGRRWLEKSAAQGNQDAQAALQRIGLSK